MRNGQQPTVMPGGGLRVVSDRLSLSLERNGLLTLVAAVDSGYLALASSNVVAHIAFWRSR